jgi:hypothetical protein
VEAWQRGTVPPTPEELADPEDFLREREEMRQHSAQRQEERLAEPCSEAPLFHVEHG